MVEEEKKDDASTISREVYAEAQGTHDVKEIESMCAAQEDAKRRSEQETILDAYSRLGML